MPGTRPARRWIGRPGRRPTRQEGAVEPLDLAVGPWAVGSDQHVPGPQGGEGLGEGGRVAVVEGVVGHHPLDAGDAVGGEEGRRAGEEAGAGASALIGVQLGVGEAAVVVDRRVQVVIAGPPLGAGPPGPPAGPPAATVGDAPELLHVQMHQLTWALALIAQPAHRPAAHPLAGERVELAEARQAVAGDHPADRRGGDPQLGADPVGAAAMPAAGREDQRLQRGRGAMRAAVGPARAVRQAALALGAKAPQPLVGGGP